MLNLKLQQQIFPIIAFDSTEQWENLRVFASYSGYGRNWNTSMFLSYVIYIFE